MNEYDINEPSIEKNLQICLKTLFETADAQTGNILVVGCSTSEVIGERIGSRSNKKVAEILIRLLLHSCNEKRIFLAIQCCEHLNRAIVVENECMQKYQLEQVNVRPVSGAGGAMAEIAMGTFQQPVVVESIHAHMGIDIGGVLIGMHLRSVAVPVRCPVKSIGHANVVMARTRSKYIGGPRAQYRENTEQ